MEGDEERWFMWSDFEGKRRGLMSSLRGRGGAEMGADGDWLIRSSSDLNPGGSINRADLTSLWNRIFQGGKASCKVGGAYPDIYIIYTILYYIISYIYRVREGGGTWVAQQSVFLDNMETCSSTREGCVDG